VAVGGGAEEGAEGIEGGAGELEELVTVDLFASEVAVEDEEVGRGLVDGVIVAVVLEEGGLGKAIEARETRDTREKGSPFPEVATERRPTKFVDKVIHGARR